MSNEGIDGGTPEHARQATVSKHKRVIIHHRSGVFAALWGPANLPLTRRGTDLVIGISDPYVLTWEASNATSHVGRVICSQSQLSTAIDPATGHPRYGLAITVTDLAMEIIEVDGPQIPDHLADIDGLVRLV